MFTLTEVGGEFVNASGDTGSFTGARKADDGVHAGNAGYYGGTCDGFFEGSAFAILAADGSLFFYTIDNPAFPTSDGDGGGFGTLSAANGVTGTTVPNGLSVSGSLDPSTKVLTGSYGAGGTTLGTFRLTRQVVP